MAVEIPPDRAFEIQGEAAVVVEDGEWFQFVPGKDGRRRHGCCDCGLMHLIEYRIEGGDVVFRFWRDEEATAELRRKLGNGD